MAFVIDYGQAPFDESKTGFIKTDFRLTVAFP